MPSRVSRLTRREKSCPLRLKKNLVPRQVDLFAEPDKSGPMGTRSRNPLRLDRNPSNAPPTCGKYIITTLERWPCHTRVTRGSLGVVTIDSNRSFFTVINPSVRRMTQGSYHRGDRLQRLRHRAFIFSTGLNAIPNRPFQQTTTI